MTTCCEHTKGACGCLCFYLPWMNKGFYHTDVNIMCPIKNAVKYVGINIFRHWYITDTINNFTLFYILISGMGVDCDEKNWKHFAGGTPKENFEIKRPIWSISINYKNGPKRQKNGNQLKNWKLSCLLYGNILPAYSNIFNKFSFFHSYNFFQIWPPQTVKSS